MNQTQQRQYRRKKILLYLFVTFTMLAASCRMLVLSKFSFDEYFTINLVRSSWWDVIRFTALDVHPPLYYLVTKLAVTVFGENFFSWHLTSFVCFLALLYFTERFVSEQFGEKEAVYSVLALCAAPNMLRYCLQVRMYSMAMLLVTISFYLTCYLVEEYKKNPEKESGQAQRKTVRRYWVLLALVNVGAAYTHYFAGVAVAGLSVFLLFVLSGTRKGKARMGVLVCWGVYCAAMALLYLPWMFVMFRQMQDINGNYWIPRLSPDTVFGYADMLFKMSSKWLQYGLVIAFFMGCYTMLARRAGRGELWRWGSFFATGFLLAFGIGYSVFRTPILIDRYLVIVIPMLWVSVVLSLLERKEKWIEAVLLILFCLCFLENQGDLYREYDAVENSEETQCLRENVQEGDIMYHTNVQRLAERAAFLPDTRHLLQSGSDAGEAFHYWTDMIGCETVQSAVDVISRMEEETVIWCEDEDAADAFRREGFAVEEYPAWSVVFYRISRL